jgi:surface antigen
MTPNLNTRARIQRAVRNNQRIYSAWESFKNFRWFTLAVIIILPIYPSLSVIGSDYEARAGDYDETTIITAYEGDSGIEGSYINKSGLISTDFDTVSQVKKISPTLSWSENPLQRQERAKTYTVASGDTLESIANKFNISLDTILWTNDISAGDTLRVGMILRIPPVSGVVHKVVNGDTISEIARFYSVDADDIVSINGLKNAASIRTGMELIIPGAIKKSTKVATSAKSNEKPAAKSLTPVPTTTPNQKPTVVDSTTGLKSRYTIKYTGLSRWFAWGNCTWYVAQNKTVTWRGNANAWIKNAKAAGVKTGQTPIPGSIIQLSGAGYNRYYGHVGIVADVTDDHIIVKDMNYRRINEVTIRKIPKNDPAIDGFIYVD